MTVNPNRYVGICQRCDERHDLRMTCRHPRALPPEPFYEDPRTTVYDFTLDPSTPSHTHPARTAATSALVALAVLQAVDVVTTRIALRQGLTEANPLARVLIGSPVAVLVKLGIVLAILCRMDRSRPSLPFVCALWTAVGVYLLTVVLAVQAIA